MNIRINKTLKYLTALVIVFVVFWFISKKDPRQERINSVLKKHHLKIEDLGLTTPVIYPNYGDAVEIYNDEVNAMIDSINKLPILPNERVK